MEPLIYTKDGNVPQSSVRYEHEWIDTPDQTVLLERWFNLESGELVKNNCHMYARKGLSLGAEQAQM